MERGEYQVMYASEEGHWWYWGLRDLVLSYVAAGTAGRASALVLDAGCGTGKHLEALAGLRVRAVGLELATEAFRFLRDRGLDNVARASICRIPFPDGSFDLVLSTDVVCCVEPPGDRAALRELARVLQPGGTLLLNLPAYEALRSRHDAAVHVRQRFTRGSLVKLLGAAGLRVRTATYRNTILFPVAAAVRMVRRGRGHEHGPAPTSDLALPPGLINGLLKVPLFLENRWIRAGGRLPFGLSVFCVATRSPSGTMTDVGWFL